MSPQADSILFRSNFTQRSALLCFCGVTAVIVTNLALESLYFSALGLLIALFLLSHAHLKRARPVSPLSMWFFVLILAGSMGSSLLVADEQDLVQLVVRIACGVAWALWLGTIMSWKVLRSGLVGARLPLQIVSILDQSILHGALTQKEWRSRRDAARLRSAGVQLSLRSWSSLLAEGAISSLERVEKAQLGMALRSASANEMGRAERFFLNRVCLKKDSATLLSSVSLTLQPKQWVGLCGASGAGKSSLLKLMSGLCAPTNGTYERFEYEVNSGTPLSRRLDGRIGFLLQNPEHHFIETLVADDITWGLRQRDFSQSEAELRLKEVSEDLGLVHLLERPCHALSFGEQRRVALAGVLVLRPQLLLLDEPTAGLDPPNAQRLQATIQRYIETHHAACLWATHDLHHWPEGISRIVLLQKGRVVFDGPQREALTPQRLQQADLMTKAKVIE